MMKYKLFLSIYLLLHECSSAEVSQTVCSDIKDDTVLGSLDSTTGILTSNHEICRGRCKAETTCNAWSWKKEDKMCYLFQSKSETVSAGFTSGDKNSKGDAFVISIQFRFWNVYIVLVDLLQCKNDQSTKKVFGTKGNTFVDIPAVSLQNLRMLLIG